MRERLREYIEDQLLSGKKVGDEEDLLLSGLVDSMGVMRLIGFIEENLQVTVPPEDLTIENFTNITALSRYLESRRNG